MPWPWQTRPQQVATPESSPGGPVYDARIDPAISTADVSTAERIATQRDLHLWGEKSAPAQAFSNYWETQPSPMLGNLAALAFQRDQLERVVSRKDLPPFPGVELGHVPAFAPAPSTNPVLGTNPAALTHMAHLGPDRSSVLQARRGRRMLGHG